MKANSLKRILALILCVFSVLSSPLMIFATVSSQDQQKIDEYEKKQEELQEKIDAAQAEIDKLKENIQDKEKYASQLAGQIDNFQAQIDVLNTRIDDLEGQKSVIQEKIDALDIEIAGIEEDIQENEEQVEKTVEEAIEIATTALAEEAVMEGWGLDVDDNRTTYDVEFQGNDRDVTVDAETGEVLEID